MKNFNDDQCVLIETEQEFRAFYPQMASAKNGITYEEWIADLGKPTLPLYLLWMHSVTRGSSIVMSRNSLDTFTKKPLEVLKANEIIC